MNALSQTIVNNKLAQIADNTNNLYKEIIDDNLVKESDELDLIAERAEEDLNSLLEDSRYDYANNAVAYLYEMILVSLNIIGDIVKE